MKKYKIVNKYKFYTMISIIIAIIFASMFLIVVNAKSTSSEVLVPVYVSQGDTLWKLSAQYADEDIDIRSYINRVISINNLEDVNIKPGDLLLMPVNIE